MSVSVKMPLLGESVTEGIVTRWLKAEGDTVAMDEPLLEVSTDKVDTEIPSPAAGVLLRILAQEDETVAVGAELAVVGEPNEAPLKPAEPVSQFTPVASPDAGPETEQPAEPSPATAAEAAPSSPAPTTPSSPAPEPTPEPAAAPTPAASTPPPAAGGTPIVLPALGESVTEGIVTRWLKQVGDEVAADEPVVEVSTDKVDTEIPAPAAGILTAISVAEDETVEVGAELGLIATGAPADAPSKPASPAPAEPAAAATPAAPAAATPPPPPAPSTAPSPAPAQPAAESTPASSSGPSSGNGEVGYVTPLVRKLAAEYNVDLGSLTGTGVGGRIRKQDVLEAAKQVAQQATQQAAQQSEQPASTPSVASSAGAPTTALSPLRGRTEKMSRLRKVIAERMVESLQVSAQLTTVIEADLTRVARLRDQAKDEFVTREGVKLSFLPFLAKAAVEALKVHPSLNAVIDTAASTVTYHDTENLGVAVDTERGLLVPVIHDAGDLNVAGLAKRIADVAERTRTGKISPDELAGGTFTLTNTGSRGALFDTPIINQPQVAILGTGAVAKRPVVVTDDTGTDSIAIRSMIYLALTYDHRLVDGAEAARFLATMKQRLEEGAFESDLGL